MKIKKLITLLMIILVSLVFYGCNSNINQEEVLSYSNKITENVLESMNSLNYNDFIKDFSDDMLQTAQDKDAFLSLILPIKSEIGDYEKGSLKFLDMMKQNNFINVLYEATFTNEDSNVKISISFKEDDPEHKIYNLYLNSPKIKKLSDEHK